MADPFAAAHAAPLDASHDADGAPSLEPASFPSRNRGALLWTAAALLGGGALTAAFYPNTTAGPADEPGVSALVQRSDPHQELAGLTAPARAELSPEQIIEKRALTASASPGWHWAIPPRAVDVNTPGELKFVRLAFAQPSPETNEMPSMEWRMTPDQLIVPIAREEGAVYQLVALDSHGDRVDINVKTRDPNSFGFFVTRVPDVRWIGFQAGRPDELAKIASATFEQARANGINLLRTGTEGQPYEFALTDINGRVVTNQNLSGKTVVMVEWATWCMSCHALMKDLFPALEQYGNSVQLVLIGHDKPDRREAAMREIAGFPRGAINIGLFAMTGTDGTVPSDLDSMWALARKGVNAYGIPTVLIVGPDGTLLLDQAAPSMHTITDRISRAQPAKPTDAAQTAAAGGGN